MAITTRWVRWSVCALVVSATVMTAPSLRAGVVPGEDCVDCEPIVDGTYTGSTAGYVGTDISPCTSNDTRDRWFCYTAPISGLIYTSLCGSAFDTSLMVLNACPPIPPAVVVDCNDDSGGICGSQSQLEWTAVQGMTYYIRVAGWNGTSGNYNLRVLTNPVLGGPITNPANGHQYFLLHAMGWTSAEVFAQRLGGHLATVNDAAENEWIRVNLGNLGGTARRTWIGLNDTGTEGAFVYTGENSAYRNWDTGEPNTSLNNLDDHVYLMPATGKMADGVNQPTSFAVFGVVEVVPVTGDLNCDGVRDVNDVLPFVTALVDPVAYAQTYPNCDVGRANINADAAADGLDVAPFVSLLVGP